MDGVVEVNDSKRQQEEIERDLQWLAGVCERSAEIDPARIKRAVRMAIEEQWLTRNLSLDVPAGLSTRARQAVRDALAPASAPLVQVCGHRRVTHVWAWIGGGLAAAAAITLTVFGLGRMAGTRDGDETSTNFVSAFEEFKDEYGDLDRELSRLREAFSELDQTVAHGWGDESWEEPVDEASSSAGDGV